MQKYWRVFTDGIHHDGLTECGGSLSKNFDGLVLKILEDLGAFLHYQIVLALLPNPPSRGCDLRKWVILSCTWSDKALNWNWEGKWNRTAWFKLLLRNVDIQFSSKASEFSPPIKLNCKQPFMLAVAGIRWASKIRESGITSKFEPSKDERRPLNVFHVIVMWVSLTATMPSTPCASIGES